MKNLPLLFITIFSTLALVVGVAVFFSAPEEVAGPADPLVVVGQRALAEINTKKLEEVEATISAEIVEKPTLVVFSDFQCPACKYLEDSFLIRARDIYADDINIVFRHFPLDSIHPYARMAAKASEAAKDSGVFWEYHDLVFNNQDTWSGMTSKDAVRDTFIEYAVELNIDKDNFIERMESDDIKKRVNSDVADATTLKVNSTPTIYLNNNKTAPQDLSKQIELLLEN